MDLFVGLIVLADGIIVDVVRVVVQRILVKLRCADSSQTSQTHVAVSLNSKKELGDLEK